MKRIIPIIITASDVPLLQRALDAEIELRYDRGEECWGMSLAFKPDGTPAAVCMFSCWTVEHTPDGVKLYSPNGEEEGTFDNEALAEDYVSELVKAEKASRS